MKMKQNKRAVVLLVCLILVLTASVGSTLAYLLSTTEPLTSEFEAARVDCEVQSGENGSYSVKNIGNVDAYIRVTIVATWIKSDGTICAKPPKINFVLAEGWSEAEDGYYYYNKAVKADESISLLNTITHGTLEGYSLKIQIVASAVQADPASVVTDVWSSGVSGVGKDGLEIKLQPAQNEPGTDTD